MDCEFEIPEPPPVNPWEEWEKFFLYAGGILICIFISILSSNLIDWDTEPIKELEECVLQDRAELREIFGCISRMRYFEDTRLQVQNNLRASVLRELSLREVIAKARQRGATTRKTRWRAGLAIHKQIMKDRRALQRAVLKAKRQKWLRAAKLKRKRIIRKRTLDAIDDEIRRTHNSFKLSSCRAFGMQTKPPRRIERLPIRIPPRITERMLPPELRRKPRPKISENPSSKPPQKITEKLPQKHPLKIWQKLPQRLTQKLPPTVTKKIPPRITQKQSPKVTQKLPTKIPQKQSSKIPQKLISILRKRPRKILKKSPQNSFQNQLPPAKKTAQKRVRFQLKAEILNPKRPVPPRAECPTRSRAQSPVPPRTQSPLPPRAQSPTCSRAQSPVPPRALPHVPPRTQSLVLPRAQSPVPPRTQSLVPPRTQSPVPPRALPHVPPRAESPTRSKAQPTILKTDIPLRKYSYRPVPEPAIPVKPTRVSTLREWFASGFLPQAKKVWRLACRVLHLHWSIELEMARATGAPWHNYNTFLPRKPLVVEEANKSSLTKLTRKDSPRMNAGISRGAAKPDQSLKPRRSQSTGNISTLPPTMRGESERERPGRPLVREPRGGMARAASESPKVIWRL